MSSGDERGRTIDFDLEFGINASELWRPVFMLDKVIRR